MLSILINAECCTPNGLMYFGFGKTHFIEFQLTENKQLPATVSLRRKSPRAIDGKINDCVFVLPFPYSLNQSVLNYVQNKLSINVYC